MSAPKPGLSARRLADDLRGLSQLGTDAVTGLSDVVEAMHRNIAGIAPPLGTGRSGRTSGITGLVYQTIRGVTRGVGGVLDRALDLAAPTLGAAPASPLREAVLAALNGSHGDHLEASGNPLAIGMHLRRDGVALALQPAALAAALPDLGPHPLVLVHGLCMNDRQWTRQGHDHGLALARELGYTPVYLNYNSGRAVHVNGAELAGLLDQLLDAWPQPPQSLTLLGHSMGGLVIRGACQRARQDGLRWQQQLADVVFLGTPHHGAPLERAGSRLDWLMGLSPYSAPIARIGNSRSAGIRDLHSGRCQPADSQHQAADTLPDSARCFVVAGSRSPDPTATVRPAGDGLVPVASALGSHRDRALDLAIAPERQCVLGAVGHFDLLSDARVYTKLAAWLAAGRG